MRSLPALTCVVPEPSILPTCWFVPETRMPGALLLFVMLTRLAPFVKAPLWPGANVDQLRLHGGAERPLRYRLPPSTRKPVICLGVIFDRQADCLASLTYATGRRLPQADRRSEIRCRNWKPKTARLESRPATCEGLPRRIWLRPRRDEENRESHLRQPRRDVRAKPLHPSST